MHTHSSNTPQALDVGQTGIWLWNVTQDQITCHPSWARLLGWETPEQIPRKSWLPGIFSPDSEAMKKQIISDIAQGRESHEMEFRVLHRRRGLRWHLCRGKVTQRSADGQILEMIFVNTDITKQWLLTDRLKKSERQLQTVFKIIPGMIYRMALNHRRTNVFVSEQAEQVFGFSDVDAIKYRCRAVIHPEDKAEVYEEVELALEQHRAFEVIFRISDGDGGWKWVWERGFGVYDEAGKAVAIDGFITDMSHHRRAEAALRRENILLKTRMADRFRLGEIIGKSRPMQQVYQLIVKAAANPGTAIIYGPSGTGKELVARAIHDLSAQKHRPFVAVNCGAISEHLMEREFFGHSRGAFTGADAAKAGFLDQAHTGTLFLDELGEISLTMQVKLLRVLEGHGYTPVGSTQVKTPDIRIIAATNRDLKAEVAKGRIREDFYYRIHVLPIHLPPLKDRGEDIPLLVDHFMKKNAGTDQAPRLPAQILARLSSYDWPGNVRELQNVIRRYAIFGELDLPHSPELDGTAASELPREVPGATLPEKLAWVESRLIRDCLEKHRWHRGRAAKELGIDPKTLYRKIKLLGIE